MDTNKTSETESNSYHENNLPISLPQAFRGLKFAKRMAIDIGGSLTKVAYISAYSRKRPIPQTCVNQDETIKLYEVKEEDESGERLHFVKFETTFIETCLDFLEENLSKDAVLSEKHIALKVTGGGAFKYRDMITKKLGVRVDKEDEMQCLIRGCNFMLHNIPNEVFEFRRDQTPQYVFRHLLGSDLFPYLLVNIGSGVSILKVDSFDSFVRVGGTSMGGGTFWGLGSLLTSAKGFDELLDLAKGGQHSNVDMLVKDIYGGDYSSIGLPGDLTACTFGKAVRSAKSDDATTDKDTQFCGKDIVKSLLHMISNDIGQLASLHAKLHGLKRIIFGGFFIRGYPITMHTITFAINYWSKGKQKALFMRHEGYLGAIGAFIKGAEDETAAIGSSFLSNWGENYAGSSGLLTKSFKTPQPQSGMKCDVLELDRMDRVLHPFPLLYHPSKYRPDTEDLTADEAAREYWLDCFESGLHMVVSRAIESQSEQPDVKDRAEQFENKYLQRLKVLRKKPFAYGNLTVRSLLDTREQFLNEFQFSDPYATVKQKENEAALLSLPQRLAKLDKLSGYEKQFEIIEGILAGNVFDWGAKEVVKLMMNGNFEFETARNNLLARPNWLHDNVDEWIERLKGRPHRKAVMFVDNSGMDIVLGVFPFVKELLCRGTKVILAANSLPALNDVTYGELQIITEKVAAICPDIKSAVDEKRLILMESGNFSPCLDLRRIDTVLAEASSDADLVILEGMGRAIHTNYDALFTCESLKMAVIKNKWLAKRLNGEMYSVVFQYKAGEVLSKP
ncbi:4'-phosphopantetheine phosphatase-like isoform X2 [Xenia sp. Carnegie-2017]|uniref:4'-phosphopantetheine phosphatase-like isoform X2 n=1 Tax=Xenia sp. Carnegie-2017 TaxID=2897299 RepID=UPI001F04A1AE|nr:4'-phosphopantetheine phosphatase-like isoform X2 [Xenia sp. Carnegie-2017]